MCHTFNHYHRITFRIQTCTGVQITTLQVIGRQEVRIHLERCIHILNQMGTCNGITVSIAQISNAAQSTVFQIRIHSLVVWQEAGISAISRQQIHQVGSLNDGLEFTILFTTADIITHHLTRKRIEILAIGLIRATGHRPCCHQSSEPHQYHFHFIIGFHILSVLSVAIYSSYHNWSSHHY